MTEDTRVIWELPIAEAVSVTAEDIRVQVRGGRTVQASAASLRRLTERWVPAEHTGRALRIIGHAEFIVTREHDTLITDRPSVNTDPDFLDLQ